MSKTQGRLRRDHEGFDHDTCQGCDYLNTNTPGTTIKNGDRLGLTSLNLSDLASKRIFWRSGIQTSPGIYEVYLDPLKTGPIAILAVETFIPQFADFYLPLLDIVAASPNCTDIDRRALRIAIPGQTEHDYTPITELVIDSVSHLAGSTVEMTVRVEHDNTRHSIHPKSTGWQFLYTIVDSRMANDVETVGKIHKNAPTTPQDCVNQEYYEKSKVTIAFGVENLKLEVFYFTRWYNATHPERSGPWSGRKSFVIS